MKVFHTVFGRRGFSLIEVAVALMVVGLGLTALLKMFPHSLRESQKAQDDSAQTLFSDYVFSALRARAGELSSWGDNTANDWLVTANLLNVPGWFETGGIKAGVPGTPPPEFRDLGVGSYLLRLDRNESRTIIRATLWSTRFNVGAISDNDAKMDLLTRQKTAYYSEFFYLGGNQ